MTSHGILKIQKSHFGHYFLNDLLHLRDRSLHYAPKVSLALVVVKFGEK